MYISPRKLGFIGVCLFVLMMAVPSMAQNRTVKGKVTDKENKPIANASVEFRNKNPQGPGYKAKTDKKGNYVYMGLASGDYYVIVRAEGFAPEYRPVRPSIQEDSVIDFQLSPGSMDAKIGIDYTREELAQMKKDMEKAKQRESASGEVQKLFSEGLQLAQQGKHEEAIEIYKKALEKDPEQANIMGNMADSYSKMGKNDEALELYKKAIAIKPDSALYTNMGAILNNMGKIAESQEAFKQAASINPESSAQSHYNIGVTLYNNGQAAEAAEAFRQAIAKDPNYSEAYYLLGMCLAGKQDTIPEAVKSLRKYVEIGKKADQVEAAKQIITALEASTKK
jgi:tetratricopeptide (TPR) repeat protein